MGSAVAAMEAVPSPAVTSDFKGAVYGAPLTGGAYQPRRPFQVTPRLRQKFTRLEGTSYVRAP
jgi:hypothetical protein